MSTRKVKRIERNEMKLPKLTHKQMDLVTRINNFEQALLFNLETFPLDHVDFDFELNDTYETFKELLEMDIEFEEL